jgi:hypothetical protein
MRELVKYHGSSGINSRKLQHLSFAAFAFTCIQQFKRYNQKGKENKFSAPGKRRYMTTQTTLPKPKPKLTQTHPNPPKPTQTHPNPNPN